ncbi:hypothetical protein AYY26_20950 [Photobacterium phosphoreum]|uniref:hypothetical protein n=1 Tax=Photobacterium phosphoreum TaxID=659 RepID=UPI0007F974DC|nr:hypothetical protein [Photobacterium phosphoreum]OBU41476.1 hypothetical protein AYY26_20950 [Photobacterium phosphoreum]
MKRLLLNPYEVARLILLNAADYQADQEERKPDRIINVSRFVLSERALRKLSFRTRLSNEFLTQLKAEMNDIGWFMISVGDGSHIYLRIRATENWPRIGAASRYSDGKYEDLRKDTVHSLKRDDLNLLEETIEDIDSEIKHLTDDNFESYDYKNFLNI